MIDLVILPTPTFVIHMYIVHTFNFNIKCPTVFTYFTANTTICYASEKDFHKSKKFNVLNPNKSLNG